ncbi:MAG: hypothetical protein PHU31_03215 [Anaerotignum sp.]|nr:hypothetical protein [Anaerotignum sp.]
MGKEKSFQRFYTKGVDVKIIREYTNTIYKKNYSKAEVIQMDGKSDSIPLEPESYRTYQLNIVVCLGLLHFLS